MKGGCPREWGTLGLCKSHSQGWRPRLQSRCWAISSSQCFCQERLDQMILEVPSSLGFYDSVIKFAQVELLLPSGLTVCCRSSWGACSDEGVVGALVPPAPPKAPALRSQTAPPSGSPFSLSAAGARCWCLLLSRCSSPGAALPGWVRAAGQPVRRGTSCGPPGLLLCVGQGGQLPLTPQSLCWVVLPD